MFARIILESMARNPRRKLLASAVLILATAVAAATLTVALDEGNRLAREFRSFGANILVTPQADTVPLEIGGLDTRPVSAGSYLPEADLAKLKKIFWRNNIEGFTPFLEVPVEIETPSAPIETTLVGTWYRHTVPVPDEPAFVTGVEKTNPWWQVSGAWFAGGTKEVVVGRALAERLAVVLPCQVGRVGPRPVVRKNRPGHFRQGVLKADRRPLGRPFLRALVIGIERRRLGPGARPGGPELGRALRAWSGFRPVPHRGRWCWWGRTSLTRPPGFPAAPPSSPTCNGLSGSPPGSRRARRSPEGSG